jgi:hypothetical protein
MPTMSTERFIYLRNLKLLRAQLTRATDEAKSQQIVKLIEDEELNYRAKADARGRRRAMVRTFKADNAGRPMHK